MEEKPDNEADHERADDSQRPGFTLHSQHSAFVFPRTLTVVTGYGGTAGASAHREYLPA